jgi:hypothetical protein
MSEERALFESLTAEALQNSVTLLNQFGVADE